MGSPIHVCILTTAHPVDDVRVNNKFAHAFRDAGFRVSWVGPGHAFFDSTDYNRDGIDFLLSAPSRTRMDRLLASWRMRKPAATLKDVDVYYAPEPDSAKLALRLARSTGAKVVFDVHEVYHGALLDRWLLRQRLPPVRNYVRRCITHICSKCDLVVGVSDAVLTPYLLPATPHIVVRSCAPSWFAEGEAADVCGAGRTSLTLMHGKGAIERGTLEVLRAVELAGRKTRDLRVVVFTGKRAAQDADAAALTRQAQELGIADMLDLRKGVPMQEMPSILKSCDVGLIAYGRNLGVDSLPNRLFEYMAVGLPIIAPSYATEIAKIIDQEKCGLLVDFEEPSSTASAIVRLRRDPAMCRDMGRRAREAFLARHSCEAEMRPFLRIVESWFPGKGDN